MRRLPLILLCSAWFCEARQNVETAPQGDTFKFESKLNVVLVPVQVRNAHGEAVGNLKKEDFQVFDKDKLQVLTGFTIQKRALTSPGEEVPTPAPLPLAPDATNASAAVPARFIVFLFDDLHLGTADLAQAQKASTRMLAASLAESDVAAVLSTSGRTNSGLTRDRAKLAAAILRLHEQRIYRQVGPQCPDVSYYQADLILNRDDAGAFETAVQDAFACANLDRRMRSAAEQLAHTSASMSLAVGDQGTRATLQLIKLVLKKLAALPGQHTLILISPGFFSMTPEALSEKSEIVDMAAQANVTISALDARGLYVSDFDASEPGGSSQALQKKSEYRRESMSADEDVMAELAEGTGGTYFHNSNDLSGGFRNLTLAPEYLYLLEFTPQDVKPDGSFHRVKVKVDQTGLKLQARRGYYAPKASKKKPSPGAL
jgi:VWFA-related protein